MTESIVLRNARLAFCDTLFIPTKYEESSKYAKYSATFLLDPSDPKCAKSIKELRAAVDAAVNAKWPKKTPAKLKYGFGEGNDRVSGKTEKVYSGHEDMLYVSSSNRYEPKRVARNKADLTADQGVLYAGCYVDGVVSIWISDGVRNDPWVNFNLQIVRFLKDGEPFASGSSDSSSSLDALDDLDDDEDDNEL